MKFSSVKNGYSPSEVEDYIKRIRTVYDETLIAQRDRIFLLKDKLDKAESKLAEYEARKEKISKAIESALAKADEIESLTRKKMADELAALRKFHRQWVAHYAEILRRYPLDDTLSRTNEVDKAMARILGEADATPPPTMKSDTFDPVGMVEKHLAAEEVKDENFDYNAAMHPDEGLGEILKELGILFNDNSGK